MIRKYYQSIFLLLAAGLLLSLGSCNPAAKYEKTEREAIQTYLTNNPADTFTLEQSGLYYRDILVGTGRAAQTQDTAYVVYTGKYLNGNAFDSNVGVDYYKFVVGEGANIAGFDEGIIT